jgi:YD repeat-containing protein
MKTMMKLPAILASFMVLTMASTPARSDEITWDARGTPLRICNAVQKNVRFMYNALGKGATDTYADMKAYMHNVLTGKGEPEEKLRQVYEEILARIEAGEFSPPREEKGEGQLKARNTAGALCLKAFPDG